MVPVQTGFHLSSRRTSVSLPFATSRARMRSASPCLILPRSIETMFNAKVAPDVLSNLLCVGKDDLYFRREGFTMVCPSSPLSRIKTHRTLRMSPAIATGAMDRFWDVNDLVALWEAYEQWRAERAAQGMRTLYVFLAIAAVIFG